MARVLITGASGLLGANLVLAARPQDEVVAVYHQHPIERSGVRCLSADLSQPGVADSIIGDMAPDWVVHCAAATDVDACDRDPEWAARLNRDMAGWVAQAAAEAGARMAHISTDAVFDGTLAPHTEEEPASPVNVYGRTKLEGEQAVLAAHPGAAVVRTNLFGWNAQQKSGLAEWFLGRLAKGEPCPGFSDVTFNPIQAANMADWLWRVLDAGLEGIWHLGGGTCLSKFEFGVKLAEAFDLDPELVHPVSVAQASLAAVRPKGLCLDSSRIERDLGAALPSIDEGIEVLRAMDLDGRRAELWAMASVPAGSA
jgi:dTDP-4-dehydrorhamnose reductase